MIFNIIYSYIKFNICIFFVFVNIAQYSVLYKRNSNLILNYLLTNVFFKLMNIKIIIHGHEEYLTHSNLLIMSNHTCPLDGFVYLKQITDTTCSNYLYIITKSNFFGNKSDQNMLTYLFYYIQSLFMNSNHLIPYDRGNIESGAIVKDQIVDILNSGNNNVCIFPEGTGHTDGIPKQFKNGIFHLASDNDLTILPITIIYERNIGSERGEPINIMNWMNNVCHVHVHEKIKNSDWKKLQDDTFRVITQPFIDKNK